ncbi:MAG: hypothetical protein RLZZ164_668 [Actinomycetota bacterium]|jgi:phosphinothricin acetyltransferase
MSEQITFRAAKAADMQAVTDIYNFYIANTVITFDIDPHAVSDWQEKLAHLDAEGLPFIVAVTDPDEVIGFAYAGPWRTKAAYARTAEDTLYLREDFTGKGIGSKLLHELIERSKAAGLRELVAVIADQDVETSIALHEKFGFKRVGHLEGVGFKFDRWLGVVMMQKSL